MKTMMELTKILLVFASMASLVHAFKIPRPTRRPYCEDCSTQSFHNSSCDFGPVCGSTTTSHPSWTAVWNDDSPTVPYPSLVADGDTYAECALVQELVEKDKAGECNITQIVTGLTYVLIPKGVATSMCAMADFVAICPASCAALK